MMRNGPRRDDRNGNGGNGGDKRDDARHRRAVAIRLLLRTLAWVAVALAALLYVKLSRH